MKVGKLIPIGKGDFDYKEVELSNFQETFLNKLNEQLRTVQIVHIQLMFDKIQTIELKQNHERYSSTIYPRIGWDENDSSVNFDAQTTSYGALNKEEYEKFFNSVQDTYADLILLNNVDWYQLLEL